LIWVAMLLVQSLPYLAELFSEGDGGKYEFDYVDQSGELNWFDPDGRAVGDWTAFSRCWPSGC
ncbi:hypothetical protein AAIH68_35645, partial [Pseudomonas aeruginosa]|uniref:hypothetical protein n=1 Tax=Pseudomonas aeruginosa TaxID=287 RepID=UPI0031B767C3